MVEYNMNTNQQNGGNLIKIYQRDNINTVTAKNFINNFMYKSYGVITNLNSAYDLYVEKVKEFNFNKPLAISGFINLIKNGGYHIDNCLSVRYPASIMNLGLERNSDPKKIFENIPLFKLKKHKVNINLLCLKGEGNRNIFLEDKDYMNGIRKENPYIPNKVLDTVLDSIVDLDTSLKDEAKDFESTDIIEINDNLENSNNQENDNKEDIENQKESIYEPVLQINNKQEIKSENIKKENSNEIELYKKLLKATIDYNTAFQEAQFTLYECKLLKLKILQNKLENTNSDNLEKIIESINQEIK